MTHMLPILIVLLCDLGYQRLLISQEIYWSAKYFWQSMTLLATLVTKLIKAWEVHVEWPGQKPN